MQRNARGFTLLELMITVVIIAILTTLAVPAYQRYTTGARRTDAVNILQRVAAAEEQFFFTNNKYTDNAADELGLGKDGAIISNEGYYTVAVETPSDTSYKLVATPVATGLQKNDSECASFTLYNTGKKESSSGGVATCWKR